MEAKISAKSRADSEGKVWETMVGRHLNGGNFPEDHREKGKTPQEVHHKHATALFGKNYQQHPTYIKMHTAAKEAAKQISSKVGKTNRVAWTSQEGDHQRETGVKDRLSKADLIVTKSRGGAKKAISLKHGVAGRPTNYGNPGVKSIESHSGVSTSPHTREHYKFMQKHGVANLSHEEYKTHPKKELIDASNHHMMTNIARDYAHGLANKLHHSNQNKQDENIKNHIKRTIGAMGHTSGGNETEGKTHLQHFVVKSQKDKSGNYSHSVMDSEQHANNYLSHFHNLHVETAPHEDGKRGKKSVAIYGTHKATGKRMKIHEQSFYSGGRNHTLAVRGAVRLSAEHKVDSGKPSMNEAKETPLQRALRSPDAGVQKPKLLDRVKSKLKDKLGIKEEQQSDDLKGACWKGYKAVGLKKKGSRMVPNCVPVKEDVITEALDYHMQNNVPFCENIFRPGSDTFFELLREAKVLYQQGQYTPVDSFEKDLLESDIGEFAEYEGELVPLDFPFELEEDMEKYINKATYIVNKAIPSLEREFKKKISDAEELAANHSPGGKLPRGVARNPAIAAKAKEDAAKAKNSLVVFARMKANRTKGLERAKKRSMTEEVKPYVSKLKNQWQVLNHNGEVVFSHTDRTKAISHLKRNYDKYRDPKHLIGEGSDLNCPSCGANHGKDRENPKDKTCSSCGHKFTNIHGYSNETDNDSEAADWLKRFNAKNPMKEAMNNRVVKIHVRGQNVVVHRHDSEANGTYKQVKHHSSAKAAQTYARELHKAGGRSAELVISEAEQIDEISQQRSAELKTRAKNSEEIAKDAQASGDLETASRHNIHAGRIYTHIANRSMAATRKSLAATRKNLEDMKRMRAGETVNEEDKTGGKGIGKPFRKNGGGAVYVRSGDGVKLVNFSQSGMTKKFNDPGALKSFMARHHCMTNSDKTSASYWACRWPRYFSSSGKKWW